MTGGGPASRKIWRRPCAGVGVGRRRVRGSVAAGRWRGGARDAGGADSAPLAARRPADGGVRVGSCAGGSRLFPITTTTDLLTRSHRLCSVRQHAHDGLTRRACAAHPRRHKTHDHTPSIASLSRKRLIRSATLYGPSREYSRAPSAPSRCSVPAAAASLAAGAAGRAALAAARLLLALLGGFVGAVGLVPRHVLLRVPGRRRVVAVPADHAGQAATHPSGFGSPRPLRDRVGDRGGGSWRVGVHGGARGSKHPEAGRGHDQGQEQENELPHLR